MLYLCTTSEGGYDWAGLEALKTHVSLDEALLIEAIKCEAGDSRHQFQIWYGEYVKQNKASNQATLGTLDATAVGEELKMTRQAIEEHERLLADHRLALMNGKPTMAPEDVDALHATINGLRANLPAIEAEYARLMSEEHRDG